jgi:hypothetical protein
MVPVINCLPNGVRSVSWKKFWCSAVSETTCPIDGYSCWQYLASDNQQARHVSEIKFITSVPA